MSVGERIAQERKKAGLSQEALGEKLGVSRQAIYKWESGATLPEVEKLIALAKLFGVSVGWLLCVEQAQPQDSGELSAQQLAMVEEIVSRYLEKQPKPKKPRRAVVLAACAAVVAVVIVIGTLIGRLNNLSDQYVHLQNSITQISYNVNQQVSGISNRVEELLNSQNALVASCETELLSRDLQTNTATFFASALPKTYVEGMEATFVIDWGEGSEEIPGILDVGNAFHAELSCPLTDEIKLSVVFTTDDVRQTQVLEVYSYLYTESIPDGYTDYCKLTADGFATDYATFMVGRWNENAAEIASVRMAFFRADTKQALFGLTPCDQPESYHGDWSDHLFFELPENDFRPETGVTYCFAALVTDEYGRQIVIPGDPTMVEDDVASSSTTTAWEYDTDPAHWDFSTAK